MSKVPSLIWSLEAEPLIDSLGNWATLTQPTVWCWVRAMPLLPSTGYRSQQLARQHRAQRARLLERPRDTGHCSTSKSRKSSARKGFGSYPGRGVNGSTGERAITG